MKYIENALWCRVIAEDYDGSGVEVSADDNRYNYRLVNYRGDMLARWTNRDGAVSYMGEDVIAEAEERVVNLFVQYAKMVVKGQHTRNYKRLQKLARGFLQCYETDLTKHDAYTLATVKPKTFLWAVRPSGTWLIYNETDNGVHRGCVARDGAHRLYAITRDGVQKLTPEQFVAYVL